MEDLKKHIVKTQEQIDAEMAKADALFQARLARERKPVFHNRRPTPMQKALKAALGGVK